MKETVKLYRHPEADDLWLRPIYYDPDSGPRWVCQLYRYSPDAPDSSRWWWDYDGRVDMKDDVQRHNLNGLISIEVSKENVDITPGDPTVVWCYVYNCGDGSVGIDWYLSEEEATAAQSEDLEPFCESDPQPVETYEGSNVWWEAVKKRKDG